MLSGALLGGSDERNPTLDEKTQRLKNRELVQGRAALGAFRELYPDVLDLTRQVSGDYGELFRERADQTRQDELAAFRRYAPQYVEGLEEADPLMAALRRLGFANATGTSESAQRYLQGVEQELGYGTDLSPTMRRDVQQGVRAGQSARGMGVGPVDTFEEALASVLEGQNLLERRQTAYRGGLSAATGAQGSLLGTLGTNQRIIGDPWQAILGRPAQPQGSNINAPYTAVSLEDLLSYGVNREIQSRNIDAASDAANKALIGSIIQGVLGGAAAGAI